jgi:D-aminopeptidase
MIVVATDAVLDARQLERLAARAIHGMARIGGAGSNGSGDYAIAFSTTMRVTNGGPALPVAGQRTLAEDELSPLLEGVIEATEEALVNSLLKATTVRGKAGRVVEAIPIGPLRKLLHPSAP